MTTGTIVAIIVVVLVVAAVIAVVVYRARRRRLQQRFGPEYDRAVEDSGSKRKGEAELSEREKRVKHLDIQSLDPAARQSYASQWTAIQEQFVDSPANAATGAQTLITSVMNERGYPTEDAAQIMADLSVEHASTLEHFRDAQDLSSRAAGGTASTEDLRQAMVHYRALFQELLGDPVSAAESGRLADGQVAGGGVTDSRVAEAVTTRPDVASPAATTPETGAYASDADADAGTYPVDTAPDTTMPADAVRTDTVPGDAVPAGAVPADAVPAEEVPASEVTAHEAPGDTAPGDTAPADAAPAANGPAAAYADSDGSAADAEDETTPAAAGRLFRRR